MKLNYKILSALFIGLLFNACTDSFEEINTNRFQITPEMAKSDGIAIGGNITAMEKCVVPVGTQADGTSIVNKYQVAYNLSADVWSGYFSQNNNWGGGANNTTYFLTDPWIAASYQAAYTDILPLWKEVKLESEKYNTPEFYALAQILKISSWHKATDMFGPIPYKKAGEPILIVPYDSQEEVYKSFFKDLEDAIKVLTEANNQGMKISPEYDAVYAGNTVKWLKYANSLMLRLAMRVRYVDLAMAQKYAEQAVNHPVGVMTSVDCTSSN
ncbi:SusD/RagB family nutrient-binding outer membrane lipoprotein [Ornithobacterium rhinotracheale]|uniref:SusD/RagB family nutrient-binding outer membrane lipoprotein n=1 Tax=Ornithobacterium rhinotracheale TaxID=28251 RepID=UPI00129C5AFF|nr:SusD/RagB family nutrient-binding outer membrane lipoprotein [Ornithobacterium rhinotracheale]MRI64468.1 SusD/RagB family nutrient-binding outer membrane lipoprotein [Ornithobacterium rhinotracheale]